MASLPQRTRTAMHGPNSPITEVLIGPGALPFPLPEDLILKMREEDHSDVTEMDWAVYHFALGLSWAFSATDEDTESVDRRSGRVKEAAKLACMDFHSVEPLL